MPTVPKHPDRKVQVRGAQRMRQKGHKRTELWFSPEELSLVTAAAHDAHKPVATWIRELAFHAAETAARDRRTRSGQRT